jgi:hypothetical protein
MRGPTTSANGQCDLGTRCSGASAHTASSSREWVRFGPALEDCYRSNSAGPTGGNARQFDPQQLPRSLQRNEIPGRVKNGPLVAQQKGDHR